MMSLKGSILQRNYVFQGQRAQVAVLHSLSHERMQGPSQFLPCHGCPDASIDKGNCCLLSLYPWVTLCDAFAHIWDPGLRVSQLEVSGHEQSPGSCMNPASIMHSCLASWLQRRGVASKESSVMGRVSPSGREGMEGRSQLYPSHSAVQWLGLMPFQSKKNKKEAATFFPFIHDAALCGACAQISDPQLRVS